MKSYVSTVLILLFFPLLIECSRTSAKIINTSTKKDIALMKTPNKAAINGLKNSIASGMAAACAKTLLAPFDTIKTIQQQSRNGGKALGMIQATKIIVTRPGGFSELYAGLGVAAIGAMPSVGLYFGVYSYTKEKLKPLLQRIASSHLDASEATINTITVATAAAIGNTIASFSRVPYEVVKQKLQTGEYSSTVFAMKDMFQTNGMRAFFPLGGISIQMIRDIPYAVVTLLTYECIRDNWVKRHEKAAWRDMVTGAVAGGIGSYATNPMDVIKTRLQVDSDLYNGSVWQCTKVTYAEGGPSAFLRGSVPRLIHKIPANGTFFVFYELFRRILRVEDESSRCKE